jgi:hypothetical protein
MQTFRFLAERHADFILQSKENVGLGPTINRAISHIKSINDWNSHPTHGDPSKVAPYIVMCQDDLIYSKDWLPILASRFRAYGMQYPLGFASGVECVEHPVRQVLADGIVLKDWIRAAQMLGTRQYWESLMPIPRFDPETGRVRAKPNDGMGSGVDWWLIRNHENSVCKTGRTCLVMPGLVQHAGYAQSTWLRNGREMPEKYVSWAGDPSIITIVECSVLSKSLPPQFQEVGTIGDVMGGLLMNIPYMGSFELRGTRRIELLQFEGSDAVRKLGSVTVTED